MSTLTADVAERKLNEYFDRTSRTSVCGIASTDGESFPYILLKRDSYLPNARCEEALKGAGIDLAKAKAEVAENWEEKLRRLG